MFKTAMCDFYLQGKCLRGADCKFAHDEREVRPRGKRLMPEEPNVRQKGKQENNNEFGRPD